jgi:hypothetical protein
MFIPHPPSEGSQQGASTIGRVLRFDLDEITHAV